MVKILDKDKALKATLSFVGASAFGFAGAIVGGVGKGILTNIFGSSVDVVTGILTNYAYDYWKGSSSPIRKKSEFELEKAVIIAVAESVAESKTHPKIMEYEKDLSKNIDNGFCSTKSDEVDKIQFFYKYWDDILIAEGINHTEWNQFFEGMDYSNILMRDQNSQLLQDGLQHIIFSNVNIEMKISFRECIKEIICPIFEDKFVKIIAGDEYCKIRVMLEYQFTVELNKMISQLRKDVSTNGEELKKLKLASEILMDKLSELGGTILELYHNSNMTLEYVTELRSMLAEVLKIVKTNPIQEKQLHNKINMVIDEKEELPVELIRNTDTRLQGEVFAVELLTKPIIIRRDKINGRFSVTINRSEVEKSIISTAAKTELCKKYVKDRVGLEELDYEIHQFMLGNSQEEEFVIDLPALGIPLRWASGGVLSVVNIERDNQLEKWTPFFFRDIDPYGWNISLGSSERQFNEQNKCTKQIEEELNYPWSFIYREFMEETLILESKPAPDKTGSYKRFYFGEELAKKQQKEAYQFSKEHISMRREEEGLLFKMSKANTNSMTNDSLEVQAASTNIDLIVIDRFGNVCKMKNVLVTFNLLELGIEIIKVLEYTLEDHNYILDGEVLYRKNGQKELVRMPCALISHEALKRSFAPDNYSPRYTSDIQPTYIANNINKDEIKIYEWDIDQREKRMNASSSQVSEAEKQRYRNSYHRFEGVFKNRTYRLGEIPNYFIPGTAKALSLYFSPIEKKNFNEK